MGSVYRARDTRLGRLVAIKLVSDQLAADPVASERLAREARLTSLLNHPNIVTVHDIGAADDGRPFIVMELVAGQSLLAGARLGTLAEAGARDRDRQRGRRGPRGRACRRDRASRLEAVEHHADGGRPREDRGLRPGQDDERRAERRRYDVLGGRFDRLVRRRGDCGLHGAGAGRRRADRFPGRPVRPGRPHLRNDFRPAGLQTRDGDPDDGGDRRRRPGTACRALP